ncbi:MAG: hypothetical protein ABR563_05295, partial [Pyrinomonadaceae bacterium]
LGSNSERMRITAAGNVGVGTSSPQARLDVAGDINTSARYMIGSNGNNNVVLNVTGGGSFTNSNTFVGVGAGAANTPGALISSGNNNSFFGLNAGHSNTTGGTNSFFGVDAGSGNTSGNDDSFFGRAAGQNNTTGTSNSFFGLQAGSNNTTGFDNSSFGVNAGRGNTTGNSNTYLGAFSDSADGLANATAVGHLAFVTQSNSLVLGSINGQNGAHADTRVGIGTTAPTAKLDVNGVINVSDGSTKSFFGGVATEVNAQLINFGMNDSRFGLGITTAQGGFLRLDTRAGQNLFQFFGRAAGGTTLSELMDISSAGNVGIGTIAPNEKLQVQGGNVYVGSPGQGIILKSPDGNTCKRLTIDNTGALITSPLTCP